MNMLLQDWDLPPFDKIDIRDYEPAIHAALDEARHNIETIATNPEEPTFANTVEALEYADSHFQRIAAIMINLNECCTSDELQEVVMRLEPEITRFSTEVMTDHRLYKRLKEVADSGWIAATVEQETLLNQLLKSFVRHGVALEGEAAERYKRNEEELSELKLCFGQNALADLNAWTLHLNSEEDLEGLPKAVCDDAREEARNRGLSGWLFTLAAPSYIPFITYSTRRNLREKMYRAYGSIGNRGNEHDNNSVIQRIVALRAEQAHLLGYPTYCDYILEDRMVQSLPNLQHFMQEMEDAVLSGAKVDLADIERLHRSTCHEGQDDTVLQPWDFSYYAEQLKKQRYDFDSEALRPYFPLDAVRDGIFNLYGQLYGLQFSEDPTIPVYHKDVRVYRVNKGSHEMGILYLDMFPRPSKRNGAWMTEFRGQHGDVRPQIQVVCNFSKPTPETPALLRFGEVKTFMHEMGHAMHGMLSEVQYESLSGTNVKRDFVEMPSQLMENWCYKPEFLNTFARHWQSGELLPQEYIDKIRAAQNHLVAWYCLRQINLGLTDIAFHTSDWSEMPHPFRAESIEATAMTNLMPRVEGCCTATNFGHIFDGGYASGYYGYKWAEVLDADIFSRFEADGIFNRNTAEDFRREILSRGGTEPPAVLFRNFMGRNPNQQALLHRMGLASL